MRPGATEQDTDVDRGRADPSTAPGPVRDAVQAGAEPFAGAFRWSLLQQAPRGVWLLTATFLLLLFVGTAFYPPYRGPDEPQHVDLAVAVAQGFDPLWLPESRQISQAALDAGLLDNTRIGVPQRLADREPSPRPERPSFEELGVDQESDRGNQLVQHPPGYYLLLAGLLRAVPSWQQLPADLVIYLMRMVGVLLVAPLPLVAWATARRVGGPPVVALAAATAVLGIPQLVHITASVNNDSLQNLTAALCTMFVAFVATGDTSRRTAVWAGLVLGAGLLAKGLLLVFVGVLGLAYAVAWWRARGHRTAVVGSAAVALLVAGVVGGWWWVRNVVLTGRVQPAGFERPVEQVRGWGAEAWVWLDDLVTLVLIRFWFDHPSGSQTGVSVTASFAVTALVALAVLLALLGRRRPDAPGAAVLLLLVLPILLLGALVAMGSWESFRLGYEQPALQGRYLFGGIVGTGVVTAVGLRAAVAERVSALFPLLAVLLWALASQALAAASVVRLYWWPSEGGVVRLVTSMSQTLPWPGPVVPSALAATVVLAAVTAVALVRDARAATGDRGAEDRR